VARAFRRAESTVGDTGPGDRLASISYWAAAVD